MSVPNPATTDWVPVYAGPNLTYEGDFSGATTYADGDIVVKDGVVYLCVGGPTTTPPDPVPWGAAALVTAVSYGTSLPASPVDGQEAILVDTLIGPSYQWRFRYNAGSGYAEKWEFIGGTPLIVTKTVGSNMAVTGSNQLVPGGVALSIPKTGLYRVQWSLHGNGSGFTAHITNAALYVGGAVGQGKIWAGAGSANTTDFTVVGDDLLGLVAAAAIGITVTSAQANTWGISNASIALTPVRLV